MISSYKIKNGAANTVAALKPNSGALFTDLENERRKRLAADHRAAETMFSNRLLAVSYSDGFARMTLQMQPILFKIGEVVCQSDDDSQFIYFPETAVFSQMNILENGKTSETAMIGDEGIVGTAAILGRQPNNFWIQTLTAGSAFRLNAKIFKQELNLGGTLQTVFFEYLNTYIRQVSQRVVCNNHHRIENRFSTWLLMLADRSRKSRLSLTQEQIAAALGVQRPSVTCIAQNLRNSGSIDYLRGQIVLHRQKLEATACECYAAIQ